MEKMEATAGKDYLTAKDAKSAKKIQKELFALFASFAVKICSYPPISRHPVGLENTRTIGCRLPNIESFHHQRGVHGDVGRDGVIGPEMNPGVAGTQGEIRLEHARSKKLKEDKDN